MIFLVGCVTYILSPSATQVQTNNTFTVDISLDHCLGPIFFLPNKYICTDTSDVYGVGFDLNYDPTVLRFQGIDVSQSVLQNVTAVTSFRNSKTENGKLVVAITKSGQVPGEQGQGKIATITFQAINSGSTSITFKDPYLLDSTGKVLVGWPFFGAGFHEASVSVTP
jgi:hypothetical protein